MRFLRILPEVWARIVWSLSSFTRNIALGSNSSTTPLNSIRSSLAIRPPVGASTKDESGPENGLGHGHSRCLPAGAKQALPPDARKGKRKERHVSALFPHCSPWLVALPAPVRRCRRAGALSFRPVLGGSRPCEQPARAKLTPRAECPQRGPYRPYACARWRVGFGDRLRRPADPPCGLHPYGRSAEALVERQLRQGSAQRYSLSLRRRWRTAQ